MMSCLGGGEDQQEARKASAGLRKNTASKAKSGDLNLPSAHFDLSFLVFPVCFREIKESKCSENWVRLPEFAFMFGPARL